MRILLIEDDKEAARLLARGLREEGWIVDIAFSGAAGDEMASVNTYDAIVLDWMLPDRDGVAICRGLRESGLHAPILMLTARAASTRGPMTTSPSRLPFLSWSPASTLCSGAPSSPGRSS